MPIPCGCQVQCSAERHRAQIVWFCLGPILRLADDCWHTCLVRCGSSQVMLIYCCCCRRRARRSGQSARPPWERAEPSVHQGVLHRDEPSRWPAARHRPSGGSAHPRDRRAVDRLGRGACTPSRSRSRSNWQRPRPAVSCPRGTSSPTRRSCGPAKATTAAIALSTTDVIPDSLSELIEPLALQLPSPEASRTSVQLREVVATLICARALRRSRESFPPYFHASANTLERRFKTWRDLDQWHKIQTTIREHNAGSELEPSSRSEPGQRHQNQASLRVARSVTRYPR
jgi:hypothetical protein